LKNWCRDVISIEGSDCYAEIRHLVATDPVEPYAWALLSPFGFNETQVSNILECLSKENSKIFYSPTHRLVKERSRLIISPVEQAADIKSFNIGYFDHKKTITEPLILRFERIIDVTNYKIPATGNIASLDFDKLQFPLLLRKWQQGDVFYPLGMKRKKKLSDFFIDQKFSFKEKEHTWILCSGNEIVWIIGRRIDHRFRVTAETTELLRIETSYE
jgi:tRNA(Ile)-lysidine synthase